MKLLHVPCLLALVLLYAGCATREGNVGFAPKGEPIPPSPEAYASYTAAMAPVDGYEMAYEWQQKDPEAVVEATRPEVLAELIKDAAAADALLARIGKAYDGDPLALTQISSVTQLVMCPKWSRAPACRKVWVAALERARARTDDGYVRTFCDQQLRLCK